MTPRDRLNRAALRATADDPARVGYWLARHRKAEGLTDDALATRLGTDARGLALLAVCEVPRPESFAAGVTSLAKVVGTNSAALAHLLRQEQALAAWAADGASAPTDVGWLLAAHDADQPPPGDDNDPPLG